MTCPADATLLRVGQTGDIRYRSSRIQVGMGLAGELARVAEGAGQVEVCYAPHRVRCVPIDSLSAPHRL